MAGLFGLVFGAAFLLRDLNVWTFWNIQWYTVFFLLGGLTAAASSGCKDCKALRVARK
jgi:hypothetical protein